MDFDPTTGTLYIADGGTGGGNLSTLNPAHGNVTLVGSLGLTNGSAGLAFSPVTPDPGTFSLPIVGIAALCAAREFTINPKLLFVFARGSGAGVRRHWSRDSN
jgi:hypothetical protein